MVYLSRANSATHRDINAWIDKSYPQHLFFNTVNTRDSYYYLYNPASRISLSALGWLRLDCQPPTSSNWYAMDPSSQTLPLFSPDSVEVHHLGRVRNEKFRDQHLFHSGSDKSIGLSDHQDSWKVWRSCQKGHNMSVMVWNARRPKLVMNEVSTSRSTYRLPLTNRQSSKLPGL